MSNDQQLEQRETNQIKVVVVYTTTIGNTAKMAEAVTRGVNSVEGAEATLLEAAEAVEDKDKTERTKQLLRQSDALILGSPVRHRSADARLKRFIEETIEVMWLTDELIGKVGGVFSVGGGYGDTGAGAEVMQLGLLAALAGAGMILVPLPKTTPGFAVAGSHWGAHGRSGEMREMRPVGVSEEMLDCAFHHGASIARVAFELRGKDLLARGNVAPPPDVLAMFQPPTE